MEWVGDSSEYAVGRQIFYLSGFQTVILEKGTLEEQYQRQSVCVYGGVCGGGVPSQLHIKGLKVHFPGREAPHRPDPRLAQAPARAVCGRSRAVHSNQFPFSLQQSVLWEELLQPT